MASIAATSLPMRTAAARERSEARRRAVSRLTGSSMSGRAAGTVGSAPSSASATEAPAGAVARSPRWWRWAELAWAQMGSLTVLVS